MLKGGAANKGAAASRAPRRDNAGASHKHLARSTSPAARLVKARSSDASSSSEQKKEKAPKKVAKAAPLVPSPERKSGRTQRKPVSYKEQVRINNGKTCLFEFTLSVPVLMVIQHPSTVVHGSSSILCYVFLV